MRSDYTAVLIVADWTFLLPGAAAAGEAENELTQQF
jgi:hypothetical protein